MRFDGSVLLEMLFAYDDEGQILYVNKQAVHELGYQDLADMGGILIGDIFVGESEGGEDLCRLAGEKEISGLVAYRKNRTCFPVYVLALPAAGEKGENLILALNMLAHANLEKEILALRVEAEEVGKNRNEFISNMTHELRTPINGIRGHVSAMLRSSTSADDRKTYAIIQKCCEDMSYIIDNILDFSKLEAGKFELSDAVFDLYELLNHIVAANLAVINEKGLRIILNIADNVPREVCGDEVRLRQILNNLVSNAIKFTDIGHVGIDVNRQGQSGNETELFFVVRDTGIGIPPEQMDKLFKSYSQVDGSSTRKYGGTGLGLMISKELIGLMGGNIHVESTPGRGSSFSFDIHMKRADQAAAQVVREEEDAPPIINVAHGDLYENILQNWTFEQFREVDPIFQFATPENISEVEKRCRILILAIELEAWEKAETNIETLKKLVKDGPEDLKKLLFRLGMAARREEGDKSRKTYQAMMARLEEEGYGRPRQP